MISIFFVVYLKKKCIFVATYLRLWYSGIIKIAL